MSSSRALPILTSGIWPMRRRLGREETNTMTNLIHPVLLCGGSGTRLWPLSRKSHPKQFVKLLGEESLFQSSARRLSGAGFAAPSVVTGSDFRFMVVEQLAAVEIAPHQILIEPSARNTAAAICAAAVALDAKNGDSLMLVAPSDHVIPDAEGFRGTVEAAVPTALAGQIVTFGIRPDRAETGYGWLELTARAAEGSPPTPQPLRSFVEKPDAEAAEALLAAACTCGMRVFSSSQRQLFCRHLRNTRRKHLRVCAVPTVQLKPTSGSPALQLSPGPSSRTSQSTTPSWSARQTCL